MFFKFTFGFNNIGEMYMISQNHPKTLICGTERAESFEQKSY